MEKDEQQIDYVIAENIVSDPFLVNQCKANIKFDSLEFKNRIKTRQYKPSIDPKYVLIYPGLNVHGTCDNKNCRGFHQRVWVKKGYGKFSLDRIRIKNKCPDCDQPMSMHSFKGFGYTRADVQFEGVKILDGKEVDFNLKDTQNQGELVKFDGADENIVEWAYLDITVMQNSKSNVPSKRR